MREKLRYDSWYCGLCYRLGKDYGAAARLCLSFDCTFLALILGSMEVMQPYEMRHCPFKPLGKKRAVITADSPSMDFAAASCILLAKYKLDDDASDGARLRSLGKLPLHSAIKKAQRRYPLLDETIRSNLRKLAAIEKARIPSPDPPANAFGSLLSELLALAPADEGMLPVLSELGFWIGRFIYLIDAWDDRDHDSKHGLYNPFLLSGADRATAEFLLNLSINSAIDAFDLLDIRSDGELASNIIAEGLFAAMDRIMNKIEPLPKEENE